MKYCTMHVSQLTHSVYDELAAATASLAVYQAEAKKTEWLILSSTLDEQQNKTKQYSHVAGGEHGWRMRK